MEAPSRLERMQSMLAFIDSHGLSSGLDLHSNRFLADLLLFFVQPRGMVCVEKKFSLALDFLNKVTPEVIEELRCFEFDDMDQDLIQKIKTPSSNLTLNPLASTSRCHSTREKEEEVIERNWVDLPPGHFPLILEKLPEINDFVRSRAVCKPWRLFSSISDLPPQFPWLLKESAGPNLEFYSIAFNKLYTIRTRCPSGKSFFGPVGGYLLTGHVDYADSFSLLNPLNNREISLPVLHDSDPFKFAFNFSWYNTPRFQIGDYLLFSEYEMSLSVHCKPGDDWWGIIGPGCKGQYRPFYLKGLLFMVDRDTGVTKIMDVSTHKELYVIPPPKHENMAQSSNAVPYLVESCGEILAICHSQSDEYTDYKFYIHRLEFGNRKMNHCWVKLSSIGDRILFLETPLGCGRGLCLRVSDFAGFKGNCIYFTIKVRGFYFAHVNVVNMYDIENGETAFIDTPFNRYDNISWFMPTLDHM